MITGRKGPGTARRRPFQAVMPRTAGFNSVDPGDLNTGTLLGSDALMFIGGGSAGTAGGIKVARSPSCSWRSSPS